MEISLEEIPYFGRLEITDNVISGLIKFMEKAGNLKVPDKPEFPSESNRKLIVRLLKEEVAETQEASFEGDYEGYLDGLGDVLFVVCTAVLNCGVDPFELLQEITNSNLTKFREGHYWDERGKLIKSPRYDPVALKRFLQE